MSVNLISEQDLREALRPHRVDRESFAEAVQSKLELAASERAENPLVELSPVLRSAATYLPLAVLSGCMKSPVAAGAARPVVAYKILSWLAFPAISLFVLFGATIFSAAKIRTIRNTPNSEIDDQQALEAALKLWWRQHQWGAGGVAAVTLILALIKATFLLFLLYIVSFSIAIYTLASLAKSGLGHRQVIGRACVVAFCFLGQVGTIVGIGDQEIHFVDQMLLGTVFFGGAMILMVALFCLKRSDGKNVTPELSAVFVGGFVCLGIPLLLWFTSSLVWIPGPTQIKTFVESFDNAPFHSSSWHQWEIPARWTLESNLNPDLTLPRRLLDKEIAGKQDRFVLGTALRMDMLPVNRLQELHEYADMRTDLLRPLPEGLKPYAITSIEQFDWVIRSAVLQNDLPTADRDLLEQRLLLTFDDTLSRQLVTLKELLHITKLFDVIGRPIDYSQYRDRIHDLLREFHAIHTSPFELAGGFQTYRNQSSFFGRYQMGGTVDATSYAVELMQIYGVPAGIDLNWVRSYLKPLAMRFQNDKWIAAATRERLDQIPGMTRPSLIEILYYERTLLAAFVLVVICFYATFSLPVQRTTEQNSLNEIS